MKIKIVTDSTCDLSHTFTAQNDIAVIPMRIFFGEQEFIDGVNISSPQFYQRLKTAKQVPMTRQPSPGDFIEVYQRYLKNYDFIFSIHLSSNLTTSVQSALAARSFFIKNKNLMNKIKIFDTRTTSLGLGFIVWEVLEALSQKTKIAAIEKLIANLSNRMQMYFVVPNLEYLYRGGRIGLAEHLMGSLGKRKPILLLNGEKGIVESAGTVGRLEEGIDYLVDVVKKNLKQAQAKRIGIIHTQNSTQAAVLQNRLAEILNPEIQFIVHEASPVLAAHTGPGGIGVVFLR
jgi:DegV family protein with EDD domain